MKEQINKIRQILISKHEINSDNKKMEMCMVEYATAMCRKQREMDKQAIRGVRLGIFETEIENILDYTKLAVE